MKRETIIQKSETDWKSIDAMKDQDIDFSDLPEVSPDKFTNAIVRKALKQVPNKTQISLHIDTDVLNWFKAQGKEYQSNINSLLKSYKSYMEANQSHS
ncbi:BrnA antitoxin family protein [Candidatus Marithrix sp. Canyon 246]|uniref:BrnA antitoxin family protein n=1 Tax=Candidatus Marithrix sp. Canyon 246 TaxID=1827136 RepID=UPI00084A2493|nr:BrnA antitoxin family protein [Candidatus Marithrix sp. Canyon 246]